MFRNWKMGARITSIVALVVALGIGMLFIISNKNMTVAMRDNAINNMQTALGAQTQIIEQYVEMNETMLQSYAQAPIVTKILQNETDSDITKQAQTYTKQYFEKLGNWEGLYISTWGSKVLTHPSESAIGMVMRKDDSLKSLQNSMLGSGGVFNAGILVSPASGNLVMSAYAPVFDKDGTTPIGYVGGATLATSLKDELDNLNMVGFDNAVSYMINVNMGTHIFDKDESLIGTEITNDMLKKVIETVKNSEKDELGTFEYEESGEKHIAAYKFIKERGWAIVLSDTEKEIFATAKNNAVKLGIICIVAFFGIAALTLVLVIISTKPLGKIQKAIGSLETLDLQQCKDIQPYVGTRSEVGIIASAVDSLRNTLREIVDTIRNCSSSLDEASDSMNAESEHLIEYVTDNSATTEELAASITTTNDAISAMESKMAYIVRMVDDVEKKIEDSRAKSNILMRSAEDMEAMANTSLNNSKQNISDNRA